MSELVYDSNAIFDESSCTRSGYGCVDTVMSYWVALRGTRTAPHRNEIDPRALAGTLEHVFLADLVAPGVARIRIAGASFSDLLGMDTRGMPLTALFAGNARHEAVLAVKQAGAGARVLLNLRADQGFATPALHGMLAIMPLADCTGRITRLLGVMGLQGTIGRCPRRFDIASPALLTAQSDRQTAGLTVRGMDREPDCIRKPGVFKPSARPVSDRAPSQEGHCKPMLRVIDGGRR